MIPLTEDQALAVVSMLNHITTYTAMLRNATTKDELYELKKYQSYVLTGFAGTGKTVVIDALYQELQKLSTKFDEDQRLTGVITAFTGRACENLSERGVPCSTAHALFYEAVLDHNGNLLYFKSKSVQDIADTIGDYVIVEEASMMNLDFIDKVMQTGKAVLFVGDDAQNGPIKGPSIFDVVGQHPDYKCTAMMMLEDIKRTGENATIDLFADKMRRTGRFDFSVAGNDIQKISKSNFNLNWLRQNWGDWDIIVCGMNKTRKKYNQLVRVAMGCGNDLPEVGERIICLKNTVVGNSRMNNGELFIVKSVFPGDKISSFQVKKVTGSEESETGSIVTINVDNNMWDEEKRLEENYSRQDLQDFSFGYAITSHKIQGSSMPNVIYYDEDVSFFLDQKKFRYTSITRPSNNLLVVL